MVQPLISFVVVSYRQERFVREAVRSALAQTYEPLEVIVSDDCSPDGTFAAIEAEVAAHRGPHKVIVQRTPRNLGLVGNFNAAVARCSGELVVAQGGDDISVPTRAAELLEARNACAEVPDLVCSYAWEMNEDGSSTERVWKDVVRGGDLAAAIRIGCCVAVGATAAYSRKLFEKYGPLPERVPMEDRVLSFRAVLEGGIRLVERPLVHYRLSAGALSAELQYRFDRRADRGKLRRRLEAELAVAQQWIRDWDLSGHNSDGIRKALIEVRDAKEIELRAFDSRRLLVPWVAANGLSRGLSLRQAAGVVRRHAL